MDPLLGEPCSPYSTSKIYNCHGETHPRVGRACFPPEELGAHVNRRHGWDKFAKYLFFFQAFKRRYLEHFAMKRQQMSGVVAWRSSATEEKSSVVSIRRYFWAPRSVNWVGKKMLGNKPWRLHFTCMFIINSIITKQHGCFTNCVALLLENNRMLKPQPILPYFLPNIMVDE